MYYREKRVWKHDLNRVLLDYAYICTHALLYSYNTILVQWRANG